MGKQCVFNPPSLPMRILSSLLLSAAMLCIASKPALGAMALMDLDSRQILQLEDARLFITEPLAEQISALLGSDAPPLSAGETTVEALVERLAKVPDKKWQTLFLESEADSSNRLIPLAAACTAAVCDGIYLSHNPLSNEETHRLLAVIVGFDTRETLDRAAAAFLREGHLRYKTTTIIRKGDGVGHAPVFKGEVSDITLVTHEDVVVTLAKTVTLSQGSKVFKMHLTRQQPIIAPVDVETQLGTLSIWLDDKCLRSVPVYAENPVQEGSLWQRVRDTILLATTDINEAEKAQ